MRLRLTRDVEQEDAGRRELTVESFVLERGAAPGLYRVRSGRGVACESFAEGAGVRTLDTDRDATYRNAERRTAAVGDEAG
ncbi:hypothetical protein MVI01_72130 [Myxococcus virescens]|uniref:Uncharacterized protein n=1 Tax=Myxococcus virescens TaxID=83456 RepID=A0A511HSG0_9BACT|nr:hypothetical protein MVI01_72130 [Myxococcus virescens]SDE88149.1 hypothetical protein SAMN04488504_11412 [Myxococcus virescens]